MIYTYNGDDFFVDDNRLDEIHSLLNQILESNNISEIAEINCRGGYLTMFLINIFNKINCLSIDRQEKYFFNLFKHKATYSLLDKLNIFSIDEKDFFINKYVNKLSLIIYSYNKSEFDKSLHDNIIEVFKNSGREDKVFIVLNELDGDLKIEVLDNVSQPNPEDQKNEEIKEEVVEESTEELKNLSNEQSNKSKNSRRKRNSKQ